MTETQTVDLAAWLTRIWDEQEAAAKLCEEVYPSPWEVSDRGWMAKVQADKPGFRVVAELEQHPSIDGWLSTRLDHFALHDPASVLARIVADRQILELHSRVVRFQWASQIAYGCAACKDTSPSQDDDTWPCETLRVMASAYEDCPDYPEEWRS